MKLYVANCTNQTNDFNYRLPESTRGPMRQVIQIGKQVEVGNFSLEEIDAITKHHAIYGMVCITEIDRVKGMKVPLIWSDKPIPSGVIERMVFHNQNVLTIQGQKTRQELAIGVDALFKRNEVEQGAPPIEKLHIHLEEETKRDRTYDTPETNEIVTVDRNLKGDNPKPTRSRKRKAA
jgi:hypothetical protein